MHAHAFENPLKGLINPHRTKQVVLGLGDNSVSLRWIWTKLTEILPTSLPELPTQFRKSLKTYVLETIKNMKYPIKFPHIRFKKSV